jgi:hypothetical protein
MSMKLLLLRTNLHRMKMHLHLHLHLHMHLNLHLNLYRVNQLHVHVLRKEPRTCNLWCCAKQAASYKATVIDAQEHSTLLCRNDSRMAV